MWRDKNYWRKIIILGWSFSEATFFIMLERNKPNIFSSSIKYELPNDPNYCPSFRLGFWPGLG